MKFKDELFSPYIFLIGFIIFCIIGLMGKLYFKEYYFFEISIYTILYILTIVAAFILGSKYYLNIQKNILILIIMFLVFLFSFKRFGHYSIILGIMSLIIVYLINKNIFSEKYRYIYIFGVVICMVNIFIIGKIPLINPEIRELTLNPLFVLGYSFILISNNFGLQKEKSPYKFFYPTIALVLFFLYGFRTYILLLIFCSIITLYLTDDKKKMIYFGAIGFIVTIALGYLTVLLLPQTWKLNPFELLWYRFTFTFDVFNKICSDVGFTIFGKYSLLTETTTGYIISENILNYSHNITSTIFGPPIFSGGILEVFIFTVLISMSLFYFYSESKKINALVPYYALVLSIFIVSIEISPYPLIILMIPLSLYVVSANTLKDNRKESKELFSIKKI